MWQKKWIRLFYGKWQEIREFDFTDLGVEYFGHKPEPQEAAGLLIKLSTAPIYFYKKGKGRYKAAPEASLQAALLGVEKKKQQALLQATYVEELKAVFCLALWLA
jgi:exoribonuclease II